MLNSYMARYHAMVAQRRKQIIGCLLYLDMLILFVFLWFFTPFYYDLTYVSDTHPVEISLSAHAEAAPASITHPVEPLPSQTQSKSVTVSNIEAPVGLKAEATRACANQGFKSLDCRNIILAISYHETGGWRDFSGDSGCSTGWVHINRCVHRHIAKAQTMDAAFAFQWTAQRLKAYGYPTYRTQAIQCHNGCYANNGYASRRIKPLIPRFSH